MFPLVFDPFPHIFDPLRIYGKSLKISVCWLVNYVLFLHIFHRFSVFNKNFKFSVFLTSFLFISIRFVSAYFGSFTFRNKVLNISVPFFIKTLKGLYSLCKHNFKWIDPRHHGFKVNIENMVLKSNCIKDHLNNAYSPFIPIIW